MTARILTILFSGEKHAVAKVYTNSQFVYPMSFRCLLCCFPLSLMDESSSPIGGTPRLLLLRCCGCLSLPLLLQHRWHLLEIMMLGRRWFVIKFLLLLKKRLCFNGWRRWHSHKRITEGQRKKKKIGERSIRNEVFRDKTKTTWECYFVSRYLNAFDSRCLN